MPSDVERGLATPVRYAVEWLARARARLRLHGVDRLGVRARVAGAPYVENLGRIEIGDDFRIGAGATRAHLVTGPIGVLRIGDGVVIGAGAAISAHASVVIHDRARLGASVMILDADYHATRDHAAEGDAAPIVIGEDAHIEDRVLVLKGATIGARAHVVAGSVVSGHVAADAFVSGVPARTTHRGSVGGDTHTLVVSALDEVFGAATARMLEEQPAALAGWDSLAALRLLVAIEARAGIRLPDREFVAARDLAAIETLVDRYRSSTIDRKNERGWRA